MDLNLITMIPEAEQAFDKWDEETHGTEQQQQQSMVISILDEPILPPDQIFHPKRKMCWYITPRGAAISAKKAAHKEANSKRIKLANKEVHWRFTEENNSDECFSSELALQTYYGIKPPKNMIV